MQVLAAARGRYPDLCDTVAQITEKWAFPHIYVWSGYILGAIACAYACHLPPRTKLRNASLVPKGS